jgi:nucleotide-binding universal stress UspA family protein
LGNILAAIDFSAVSDEVVALAGRLSRAAGDRVWLLHVAAPDPAFLGWQAGPQSTRDARAEALRSEHRDLQSRAEALRGSGLEATALLVQGGTVETILAEAERLHAELIVVGSHGRGALGRALLGSVSEGLVRRSALPVLVVPSARRS